MKIFKLFGCLLACLTSQQPDVEARAERGQDSESETCRRKTSTARRP